jgi:hypothetical protein
MHCFCQLLIKVINQVCFGAPVTPSYFIRGGRIQGISMVRFPRGDHWGVDNWAMKLSTPLDVMWRNTFPILMWREDLIAVRLHLAQRFFGESASLEWYTGPDASCRFANDFDAAYSKITGATAALPPTNNDLWREGFSQFNIMMNYVLHRHPEKYTFYVSLNLFSGYIMSND